MSISVRVCPDPRLVIDEAGDLLAGDPVGHNVVGTKLADAIRYREPGRYWIGLADGVPAGVAVQQPADGPVAVAPMPAELVEAIADAIDADGVAPPGVSGPARTAAHFAKVWGRLRKITAVPMSAERVYEVRNVRFPDGVDGSQRPAAEADLGLLLSWLPGFEPGAGWAGTDPAAIFVTRRLAAGDVWIWDDDGPVSMAARTDAVAGVSRIQAVNTPPELRRRGYASAGVAALSADVLARGSRCVLSANVSNVVANSVYQRLGYQPVIDVLSYQLGLGPAGEISARMRVSSPRSWSQGKLACPGLSSSGRASGSKMTRIPHPRSVLTLRPKAGCLARAAFGQGTVTIGRPRPIASFSSPSARVSLIPAAHLLIVLNVAGAAAKALAGGRTSGASGSLKLVRTGWPVISATRPASKNLEPSGVVMTQVSQSPVRSATSAGSSRAGAAPEATTYNTGRSSKVTSLR